MPLTSNSRFGARPQSTLFTSERPIVLFIYLWLFSVLFSSSFQLESLLGRYFLSFSTSCLSLFLNIRIIDSESHLNSAGIPVSDAERFKTMTKNVAPAHHLWHRPLGSRVQFIDTQFRNHSLGEFCFRLSSTCWLKGTICFHLFWCPEEVIFILFFFFVSCCNCKIKMRLNLWSMNSEDCFEFNERHY